MTADERKIVESLIDIFIPNYDPCRHISESERLEAAKEAISKILRDNNAFDY